MHIKIFDEKFIYGEFTRHSWRFLCPFLHLFPSQQCNGVNPLNSIFLLIILLQLCLCLLLLLFSRHLTILFVALFHRSFSVPRKLFYNTEEIRFSCAIAPMFNVAVQVSCNLLNLFHVYVYVCVVEHKHKVALKPHNKRVFCTNFSRDLWLMQSKHATSFCGLQALFFLKLFDRKLKLLQFSQQKLHCQSQITVLNHFSLHCIACNCSIVLLKITAVAVMPRYHLFRNNISNYKQFRISSTKIIPQQWTKFLFLSNVRGAVLYISDSRVVSSRGSR